jgi:uncharacterized damage-inducible protein DinB
VTYTDEHGRPHPPAAGSELETLLGFLEHHRATLAWKCSGLDATGLAHRLPPSALTLGGLLKHLALVEQAWFRRALHTLPYLPPFDGIDWRADPDWDFESAAADSPEVLLALWRMSVADARERIDDALAVGGLDFVARGPLERDGETISLRWIVVHMIEEYARHNGHADLLREAVDGQVGE